MATLPLLDRGMANAALFLRQSNQAAALTLWNETSGMPGLLNAARVPSQRRTGYVYDPEIGIYRNAATHQKIGEAMLRQAAFKVSNESSLRMRKNTQQLIAGVILLGAWYEEMQSLMGALYQTMWLLSIGGFLFEDDVARNLFYLLALPQFTYLDNFERQLQTGEQVLDGRAMNRAGMYGTYGHGLYQNFGLLQAEQRGKTIARRILGPTEDHCHDSTERQGCWELFMKGWVPVADMVMIGEATCYSNCLCYIQYR